MIAGNLIRHAKASGIDLRLVDGKVKVIGPRAAVAHLIEPLRHHRAALTHALQIELTAALLVAGAPNRMGWHELDAAYNAHHFNCRTCIAAGRGTQHGRRCAAGLVLWNEYTEADDLQTEGGNHGRQ